MTQGVIYTVSDSANGLREFRMTGDRRNTQVSCGEFSILIPTDVIILYVESITQTRKQMIELIQENQRLKSQQYRSANL